MNSSMSYEVYPADDSYIRTDTYLFLTMLYLSDPVTMIVEDLSLLRSIIDMRRYYTMGNTHHSDITVYQQSHVDSTFTCILLVRAIPAIQVHIVSPTKTRFSVDSMVRLNDQADDLIAHTLRMSSQRGVEVDMSVQPTTFDSWEDCRLTRRRDSMYTWKESLSRLQTMLKSYTEIYVKFHVPEVYEERFRRAFELCMLLCHSMDRDINTDIGVSIGVDSDCDPSSTSFAGATYSLFLEEELVVTLHLTLMEDDSECAAYIQVYSEQEHEGTMRSMIEIKRRVDKLDPGR